MKKFIFIFLSLILLFLFFFFLFLKQDDTTLEKELSKDVDFSTIDKVEIFRSSDDKTIIIEDKIADELISKISVLNLKNDILKERDTFVSYWFTFFDDEERILGVRIDGRATLSFYIYPNQDSQSIDYFIVDTSILEFLNSLFE